MKQRPDYQVIVVGGGHAGVEAAAAAARRGASVAMLTMRASNIGVMSCNPSIGGVGKGHIVREIDALDGVIARAADDAAIHYRMLNAGKGRAVQGPRVQADRHRFAVAVRTHVASLPITVIEGEVVDLLADRGTVVGVTLADGVQLRCTATVLATGTFLGGRIFRGDERAAGGRVEERAATRLADRLCDLGLPMGRLKTGTPPRVDGRTIDWAALPEQPSDADLWRMSPMSRGDRLPQIACAVTRTGPSTHALIARDIDRSPLFGGAITGRGPRYCPSIEDKIARFGERDGHQIFLEPEGLDDPTVYPNGLSTSLPADTQERMIASIAGLERARITQFGYAVEYDYLDPRALDHRLGLGVMPGLFCAGQINGTTGYEEAAGQGLIAGANAAGYALGREPLLLDRASSYLGVMVDDLVLQGVSEPYRMLTARAEYRLRLRADNAETRLGEIGRAAGLLGAERLDRLDRRAVQRGTVDRLLDRPWGAGELARRGAPVSQVGAKHSGRRWLQSPVVKFAHVAPEAESLADADLIDEMVEDARYAPYLMRQDQEVAELRREEAIGLPPSLDYRAIPGLSHEMVERLETARPSTLAAAGRVQGVTPAALSAILLQARRRAA